jgi:hypothetical protein
MPDLARAVRWLTGRRRSARADRTKTVPAAHEAILQTIEQQRATQRRLGTTFVRRADLDRAVRDQRQLLDQARTQIEGAIAAAQRAAAEARAAGDSPVPYEQAALGLGDQLAVVDASRAQLSRVAQQALQNVARAQRVLTETGAALDAALRAQVSLLARLERLQRQRAIADATLRARGGPPGSEPAGR